MSKQIRQQLKSVQNLQLISLEEAPLDQSGGQGKMFTARYDMPPFGKQLVYRVKVISRSQDVWVATGIVKQCDDQGGRLVTAMLDSIDWSNKD